LDQSCSFRNHQAEAIKPENDMGHIGGTVGCVTSLGFGGKFLSVAWNNTEVEDMVDVSYFKICVAIVGF